MTVLGQSRRDRPVIDRFRGHERHTGVGERGESLQGHEGHTEVAEKGEDLFRGHEGHTEVAEKGEDLFRGTRVTRR
jgi:hypothetical protein